VRFFMPRYDVDLRRLAVSLMEGGAGKVALARALAIPPGTAKNWMLTYGAVGAERFIEMGSTHKAYDYETKLAAVRDHVDGGLSRREVMARYGITSASCVGAWSKLYREGGAEALRPRPKGRPRDPGPAPGARTRERELEEQNRRLRAEVAYLKKLHALMAERRATGRSPR
jgi:transposase